MSTATVGDDISVVVDRSSTQDTSASKAAGSSGIMEETTATTTTKSGVVEQYTNPMWKAKLGYAGAYFGFATMSPYYSVLFTDKGFSPSHVGLLSACMPLCLVVLLPPMTYLSDRYHNALTVTIWSIVIASCMVLVMTVSTDPLYVSIAAVIHFIASTPIYPFYDHHTMAMLPAAQKTRWGESRVFGAYGWGVGAPLASEIFGRLGWAWVTIQYVAGHACVVYTMMTTKLEMTKSTTLKYAEVWMFLLRRRRMLNFLICVCFMGAGYVLIATFLFLFLKELGAPDILLGISITTTVLVEIPLFRASKLLHQTFSDRQLFTAALLGWVFRVVGYSLLENPWHVLFLEPLHGFTFGLMWLSGVHLLNSGFPDELATSAFGFLHASAFGIGPIFGNVIGGYLYERFGPRLMFRFAAFAMFLVLIGFQLSERYFEKQTEEYAAQRKREQEENRVGHGIGLYNVVGQQEDPRHVESAGDTTLSCSMTAAVARAHLFDVESA